MEMSNLTSLGGVKLIPKIPNITKIGNYNPNPDMIDDNDPIEFIPPYSDNYDYLYIGLERSNSPVGAAIRFQTRSSVNHAWVINSHVSFEALAGFKKSQRGVKVRKVTRELYDYKNSLKIEWYRTAPIHKNALKASYEWGLTQEGKGYDWGLIAKFITRQQERRTDNGKFICSELSNILCLKASYPLLERIESWRVSPEHIRISPMIFRIKTYPFEYYESIYNAV